jgi:adenylate cyclase class 2
MSVSGGREVEIKLALRDAGEGRRRVEATGFSVVQPRVFEANVLFDTPDRRLRAAASLVRVRRAGARTLLTFKGPATYERHKAREELEVELSDAPAAAAILERLGFHPVFRYEKYRTEYAEAGQPGVITLDETPIGDFFELEGPPEWIDATAARLGFSEADYLTASYATLYSEWCRKHGVAPGDMLFAVRG